jgi:hypothetical protein
MGSAIFAWAVLLGLDAGQGALGKIDFFSAGLAHMCLVEFVGKNLHFSRTRRALTGK